MSVIVLGMGIVLAASVPTWVDARVADAAGTSTLQVPGLRVSPALAPVALAAGAGAFALTLVDGWARRAVSIVIACSGVGLLAAAIAVLVDPAGSVTAPGIAPTASTATLAPWVAILGAVVIMTGSVLALVVGGRWPSRSPRQATGSDRPTAHLSDWDALSDGEDPT